MAIKHPPVDICISKRFRGDPKGSRFKCVVPRQSVLDPPLPKTKIKTCYYFIRGHLKFKIRNKQMIGVQVGRMGCVPACGRNSNSRNVSCSQPSLHRQGAPSDRGAI